MRLAGRLPELLMRDVKRYGLPASLGETAMRVAPDALFSTMYAATVPDEYASGTERAGLFTEDFLTQSLPGMLAAGIGGAAARRFGASRQMAHQIAGGLDTVASLTFPMAAGSLGLRPVSHALDERAKKNAELQARMDREGIFQQGLQAGASQFAQTPLVQGFDGLMGLYG
jgi:hypothetical protein